MTYRDLIARLMTMPSEALDQTITIYNEENDEFYGCTGHGISVEEECDVLDHGHLFLMVNI